MIEVMAQKKLMLKIMQLNSYFVIRLKKDTFIDQRYKTTTNDEIIEVPLTKSFIKTIQDETLRNYANKEQKLKIRIINITLPTGEIETLTTNVFDKNMTIQDFKEIYNKRWTIETNYDKLKKQTRNRKLLRPQKNNHRTRLLLRRIRI